MPRTYTCAHETEPSASSYFGLDSMVLQINVMTVVPYASTHSGARVRPVCHGGAYDRHLYSCEITVLVKENRLKNQEKLSPRSCVKLVSTACITMTDLYLE